MVVHPKIIPFFVIAHGNDALHLAYTGAPHSRRRAVALARVCRFAV